MLELDSGLALPLVDACVQEVDLAAGRIVVATGFQRRITSLSFALRIDVFTLVPHAFAWLTEQRPLAAVLGTELELRLLNYRDTTPLRNGQVDDDPYGGGAGMVLRVDVVAAALEAAYGGAPDHRVIALTPQGRRLDQELVEDLAGEEHLTLLSARFEGFDERVVEHLATEAVSIGPYVLSGGELPAMVVVDAIARRLPGRARQRGVGRRGELLRGARRRPRIPPLHAAGRVPRLARAGGPALRRPRRIEEWRREQSRRGRVLRNPIDF